MVGARLRAALGSGVALVLLALPIAAWAAPGDLDASFGNGGVVDLTQAPSERLPGHFVSAIDMAPGPGGATFVLSVGVECDPGSRCRRPLVVTRYDEDGSVDRAYGDRGGTVLMLGNVDLTGSANLAVDSRGRALVAAGESDGVHVAALGPDGARDPSFGAGGEAVAASSRYASSNLAVTPSGKAVVESAWYVRHPHGTGGKTTAGVSISRFLPDGSHDRSFGGTGTVRMGLRRASPPSAMAVRVGGGVLLAGRTCCSSHEVPYLARVLAGGRVDRDFGRLPGLRRLRARGGLSVNAILLRRDGKIDVAGGVRWNRDRAPERGFVLRLRGDGRPYSRFGRGGMRLPPLPIDAAAVDRRGWTFAVAEEVSEGERVAFRLAPNGALDRSFGGRRGIPVPAAAGGEGTLVAAYSGVHPLFFSERFYVCRSSCPPDPVLVRFVGGFGPERPRR